jgi:hypothetical protein
MWSLNLLCEKIEEMYQDKHLNKMILPLMQLNQEIKINQLEFEDESHGIILNFIHNLSKELYFWKTTLL